MSRMVGVSGETHEGEDAATAAPDFDHFVATRSRALWRTAWLLTGDAQKAEDLLQTTLVKVWRHWTRIAKDDAVEAYARRALVTTYTDWWRRKWNAEAPTETLPEGTGGDDGSVEERLDLQSALGQLSKGQRAVVVLRYFEDQTEAQTAALLGCTVGTVKSQTARALTALRASNLLADREERR